MVGTRAIVGGRCGAHIWQVWALMLTPAGRLWRRSAMGYPGNTTDASRSRAYDARDDFARRGNGVVVCWRQRMSLPPRVTHRPSGGVRPALALLHGH
jgi:hypothetical protein